MNTQEDTKGPTANETLLGGKELTLTIAFAIGGGTAEGRFLVQQLPIKKFQELLNAQDDELAMADLFCGQEKGWSEKLTPESLELVILEGERLNSDFFSRWVQRRLARQEKLLPGVTQQIKDRALQASGTGSQK